MIRVASSWYVMNLGIRISSILPEIILIFYPLDVHQFSSSLQFALLSQKGALFDCPHPQRVARCFQFNFFMTDAKVTRHHQLLGNGWCDGCRQLWLFIGLAVFSPILKSSARASFNHFGNGNCLSSLQRHYFVVMTVYKTKKTSSSDNKTSSETGKIRLETKKIVKIARNSTKCQTDSRCAGMRYLWKTTVVARK